MFFIVSPSLNFSLIEDLYKLHTSFFNLSTRTRQYFGTYTFLGESFPTFMDSINALRLNLAMLIEATGGKGSSSIAIASFLSRYLSIPLLILSCMAFLKPQHALVVWFHELWYLQQVFPLSSSLLRIQWSLENVMNFSFTVKSNISFAFATSKVLQVHKNL